MSLDGVIYPVVVELQLLRTNNKEEYAACIIGYKKL